MYHTKAESTPSLLLVRIPDSHPISRFNPFAAGVKTIPSEVRLLPPSKQEGLVGRGRQRVKTEGGEGDQVD